MSESDLRKVADNVLRMECAMLDLATLCVQTCGTGAAASMQCSEEPGHIHMTPTETKQTTAANMVCPKDDQCSRITLSLLCTAALAPCPMSRGRPTSSRSGVRCSRVVPSSL